MPVFIGLAMVGVGLYAGYRWIANASQQMAADWRRAEEEAMQRASGARIEKDLGALEYDPVRGVYRPARRD